MKQKGSILVYSLIILTVMLTMTVSMTSVSIMDKKSASSTQFSTQAYATADSGVQLAIRKLNAAIGNDKEIGDVFAGCTSGKVPNNNDGGPEGALYELSFLDDSDNKLTCTDKVSEVSSIKSVGTYKGTVRAVNVAVAAEGNYQMSCYRSDNVGANIPTCCKINTSTGEMDCKAYQSGTWRSL